MSKDELLRVINNNDGDRKILSKSKKEETKNSSLKLKREKLRNV